MNSPRNKSNLKENSDDRYEEEKQEKEMSIEDDDDEEEDAFDTESQEKDLNVDFDEKDEYVSSMLLTNDTQYMNKLNEKDKDETFDNDDEDEDNEKSESDALKTNFEEKLKLKSPVSQIFQKVTASPLASASTVSSLSSSLTPIENEWDFLPKLFYDEKIISDLINVDCIYSFNQQFDSLNSKDIKHMNAKVNGKLVLTTYRLIFLPLNHESFNWTASTKLLDSDKRFQLFTCSKVPFSICVPLTTIFEQRASPMNSEKHRKLKSALEMSNMPIRDLIITCKNFMKRRFLFDNQTTSNSSSVIDFLRLLLFYSNPQSIIHNRFHYLIQRLNKKEDRLMVSNSSHSIQKSTENISEASLSSSNSSTSTATTSSPRNEPPKLLREEKRKSYLISSDLYEDLVECQCNTYMQVKSGYAEVIPNKFIIDTNMPFCVFPKNMIDIIMRRRVVLNESYVSEFVNDPNNPSPSAFQSTFGSGLSVTLNKRSSFHLTGNAKSSSSNSKLSKLSEFLNGGSPRSNKNSNNFTGSAAANAAFIQYQQPLLANVSISNPFYDNRFLTWSYTYANSGCSLIIVPESAPNRQDECDIIIKNYNSLLWDENLKQKNLIQDIINVSNNRYSQYEFFRLQVPLTFDKIASSYFKLMQLCAHSASCDFYRENETFLTRLHESKWFKNISKILELTNKIVQFLSVHKRNVFIEERRNNIDCSCILSSLVKICLNPKYRTIVGLENLIQRDWFLNGHMFLKRLYSTPASRSNNKNDFVNLDSHSTLKQKNSNGSSNLLSSVSVGGGGSTENLFSSMSKTKEEFSPTFLLFLDCLFQLTLQKPNDFEYNELYLIHLWDYSNSGMSFTYTHNGISDWLVYLNNQTFLTPTSLNDSLSNATLNVVKSSTLISNNKYLQDIFDINNLFWLNHLSKNSHLFLNKFFNETNPIPINIIDKCYMVKFWSRCYLRWLERFHSYNHWLNYLDCDQVVTDDNNFKPRRPPPPPLPPKPVKKTPSSDQNNTLNTQSKINKPEIVINNPDDSKFKIVTRITSDGNIESSF